MSREKRSPLKNLASSVRYRAELAGLLRLGLRRAFLYLRLHSRDGDCTKHICRVGHPDLVPQLGQAFTRPNESMMSFQPLQPTGAAPCGWVPCVGRRGRPRRLNLVLAAGVSSKSA
jgi:hypothetical protein